MPLRVAANWSRPIGRSALVASDWSQSELVAANWSHGTTGLGQLVAKLENLFSEITLKIFSSSNFFLYYQFIQLPPDNPSLKNVCTQLLPPWHPLPSHIHIGTPPIIATKYTIFLNVQKNI